MVTERRRIGGRIPVNKELTVTQTLSTFASYTNTTVFLTKAELATRWMVCTKTIEVWVRAGKIPKPIALSPRRLRWVLADIEQYEKTRST